MTVTSTPRMVLLLSVLCFVAAPPTLAAEMKPIRTDNEDLKRTEPVRHLNKVLVAANTTTGKNFRPVESVPLDRCETEGRLRYDPCMAKPTADREECLRVYDNTVNTCANPGPPAKGNQSQNIYRIPYADGTNVHINRDFYDHQPQGRIDMHGKGGGTHRIVAAAAGTIRHIQDGRSKQQHPEPWLRNTPDCFNNYVWIEHANHEWSKYSHMQMGTTSAKAGLKVGDKVAQGDYLGDEGKVGCAWPAHLHFQIMQVRADDKDPTIDDTTGKLKEYKFENERNPRFSDLAGKVFTFKDGENYIAGGLPKCRKDPECPSGHYCNAGVDLSTNRCMPLKADNETCDVAGGSHQCKSGHCKFGRCYTPHSVAMGGTCYVNDACQGGKCSDVEGVKGRCVCKKDADCDEGKYCDAGTDLNLNSCKPLKTDNETCDLVGGGHQCKSGYCKFSRCYTPNSVAMGGTCYNDDACKEGKCSAIDGAKGTCVCKKDSDCGTGKWCDAGFDTKVNQCRSKLNKGEKCGKALSVGNDHKCKSGKCSGAPNYKCK